MSEPLIEPPPMQLVGPEQQPIESEMAVLERLLPLEGARILELGCGAAEKTRLLVERYPVREIVAAEVDAVQHQRNLERPLERVSFRSFGAEAIDEPDASFDIVLMFKSLHHVPIPAMDSALRELRRVLKPGGLAYISEPVFAGDFNEVLKLFHDESEVRREAFAAVVRAVEAGVLELADEHFFLSPLRLDSFDQFEASILNATHTDHQLTPERLAAVRAKFESFAGPDGYRFETPNRVDLLRRAPD